MRIGVPREVKNRETRVALTAQAVQALTARGHEVRIQAGAGEGAAIPDSAFEAAGAVLVATAQEAWDAELVLKVKEPQASEYELLGSGMLFTFLHLAANEDLAKALIAARTTALSYDTVQAADGSLPILTPMSAIAGAVGVLEGAHHLLSPHGGPGKLLGGAMGVGGARVVVIGAGVAGSAALAEAVRAGADAVVLDVDKDRLRALEQRYGDAVRVEESTPGAVEREVAEADVVVGAVLVPGRPAPVVVTRRMVTAMRPGSVIVDIAIDQGGCTEVSRPTTHDDPVFLVGDTQLYCVANMPAAVGATATSALVHASYPYIEALADGGRAGIATDAALRHGLNVDEGKVQAPTVHAAFPHLRAAAHLTR
ncbi:alanine dehydrogenase [Demequina globuliformis]|uniref:alanine dehydrogenase n=1 Tax=Demequina globuliformis TaxID=676202 RepID=UPI0007825E5F|nr:alanine dehydrogenase [Demequina globuliformis]